MRTLCAVCAAMILALLAAPVGAKPPKEPDPAQESARMLALGIELQKRGRHIEAIQIFDDALALFAHVKIRYYKMNSLVALGRVEEAAAILKAIREAPELADRKDTLDRLAKTLEQALKPRPVRIEVAERLPARLSVDGKDVGLAPQNMALSPSSHRVEASLDGYITEVRTFDVAPGTTQITIKLELREKQAAPVVEPIVEPAIEPPNYWLPWTLIGAGAAAVVGASGYWAKHAIDSGNLEPGDTQSPINLILGGVVTGAGVALMATGLVLYPWDDGPQDGDEGVDVEAGFMELKGGGLFLLGGQF